MYSEYQNFLRQAIEAKNLDHFKSNFSYRIVLEHVSPSEGAQYLECIQRDFPQVDIKGYVQDNERIGGSVQTNYGGECVCSPTTLRYALHALLLLKYMKDSGITQTNIVEVGCGYGGLCLAIDRFAKLFGVSIKKYFLIDLKEPLQLQEWYLGHFTLNFPCQFENAETFGDRIQDSPLFLISNYCYSEIPQSERAQYRKKLLPRVDAGFMVWNDLAGVETIRENQKVVREVPCTQVGNMYVYF